MPSSHKKPLLKSDIERAMAVCRSAAECARFLDRSYNTFKKYAKMYGLLEDIKNPDGFGISKGPRPSEDYSRDLLIQGMYPGLRASTLRRLLIKEAIFDDKCSVCGYNERRITDYQVPLLLDFLDGDKTNVDLDNLRLLCYNCYFCNVGDVVNKSTTLG